MPGKKEIAAPIGNLLLAALPKKEYESLFPKLEQVALTSGETIYERGETIRYIYFPNSGLVSLLVAAEARSTLEVGIVGKEGIVGLSVFLGVKTSFNRAIVQGKGVAMRINAADFLTECLSSRALPQILQRYAHSLIAQVSQSAACYRFHTSETRLARWLLMSSVRLESLEFRMTQEFLANMLGVRREAINKSAGILQQQELISYSRGKISILDKTGLEKASCLCYGIIKEEEKSFPANKKLRTK